MRPCNSVPYEFYVIRDSPEVLSKLTGSKILIYWPHGFGDFVFLSYVLPFLDKSNEYFICCLGDDNASIFDASSCVTPLYTGVNSVHGTFETRFEVEHLGLCTDRSDGLRTLLLPAAIAEVCRRKGITHLLDPHFPEVYGCDPYPFHSKARRCLNMLCRSPDKALLSEPLKSSINFESPGIIKQWVESRLRSFAGLAGKKLCVIGRNGYTSTGKNWGHRWRDEMPLGKQMEGEEARDFMRLVLKHDANWLFLTCEDRMAQGFNSIRDPYLNCYSYADLFCPRDQAQFGLPYAWVLRALLSIADLVVGVPSGPYHLAMAYSKVPLIGLWTEHLPSWYDEPNDQSRHIVGRNVKDSKLVDRPGSFSRIDKLSFAIDWLDTRIISGEKVFEVMLQLLGK